jgi:ribosomal protein S18 acetylase RimI-like enzyme
MKGKINMIQKLNLKDTDEVKELLRLQIASYKVEADIMNFYEIPPLKDTIDSLKECDEIFYGLYIGNNITGIISYKIIENIVDIHRVAVYPQYFRMGIAGNLLNFVEGLHSNVKKVIVCTGKKNIPAINLYLKSGYKKINDIEVSKGVYLTKFEKTI